MQLGDSWLAAIRDGSDMPPPTLKLVGDLHTSCVLVKDCTTWLQGQDAFFLQPSSKSWYVKAKANALTPESKEVYVHTLLCYMYNGPPPTDPTKTWVAGHLCEHKNCICPWHLQWMSDGENRARHNARKKRQRFPLPPIPHPPTHPPPHYNATAMLPPSSLSASTAIFSCLAF